MTSRLGTYQENDIVVGNCLDVMSSIPSGSVNLIVTDPPYGIEYLSNHRQQPHSSNVPIAGDTGAIWNLLPTIAAEMYRIAAPDSACFVFTRWDCWSKLEVAMSPWECKNMIIWDKLNHTAGDLAGNFGFAHELVYFGVKGRPLLRGRRMWNVWKCPRVAADKLTHPSEKPVPLVSIAIRSMSDKGNIVFDPFIGSGSTAVAASCLNRQWFGCDVKKEYVELALARVKQDGQRQLLPGLEV